MRSRPRTAGWSRSARACVAYLSWWQSHPRFAVAYLVELPTAGRRALEQRDRAYASFEAMFEGLAARARAEQPKLPALPVLAPRVLVASITEIVGQEIRAGRVDALHELEDELVFFIVKTLADDRSAERARRRPRLPEVKPCGELLRPAPSSRGVSVETGEQLAGLERGHPVPVLGGERFLERQ